MVYTNIARGVANTFYITVFGTGILSGGNVFSSGTPSGQVNKDGAGWVAITSAITVLSTNALVGVVSLSATEMDAERIDVKFTNTAQDYRGGGVITIMTYKTELTAAPSINSSLTDKMTALFQYFFLKRTVTATTETLYKDNSTDALGTATISDDGTTVSKTKVS